MDNKERIGTIADPANANGGKNRDLVPGKLMRVAVLVVLVVCLLSWFLPALVIGFIQALLSVGFVLWMRARYFRIDPSTAKFLRLLIIVLVVEAIYMLFRLLS